MKNHNINEELWGDQWEEAKIGHDWLSHYLKGVTSRQRRTGLIAVILGALEDANFSSEWRKMSEEFPIEDSPINRMIQTDGVELSGFVQWDGGAIMAGAIDYIFSLPRAEKGRLYDIKKFLEKLLG